jgi:hypothetical protein
MLARESISSVCIWHDWHVNVLQLIPPKPFYLSNFKSTYLLAEFKVMIGDRGLQFHQGNAQAVLAVRKFKLISSITVEPKIALVYPTIE